MANQDSGRPGGPEGPSQGELPPQGDSLRSPPFEQPPASHGRALSGGQRSSSGSNYGDWRPDNASEGRAAGDPSPVQQGLDPALEPEFQHWLGEQMHRLDEDYGRWRQDRYRQLSEEFSSWRSTRQHDHAGANPAGAGNEDPSRGGVIAAGAASRGEEPSSP